MRSMLRRVFAAGILLSSGLLAPAAEPAALVVLRPVVNLYRNPSEDAEVIAQSLLGARVLERERKDGWVKIEGDDAYAGWLPAWAVRPLEPRESYPEPSRFLEVEALSANVFREPDVTRHAPLLNAPYGARLERLNGGKDTQRWLEVRLPDRSTGWVQTGDVRGEQPPLSIEASLLLAKRFLGVTYTWGGSSSFGFDCSGFTQAILRRRGAIMPRDAGPQARWSGVAPVAQRSELKPGDLLFFGKDEQHIVHTGMYLGDNQFIHDTPKDHPGVQISKLDDPAWSSILVAMRRLK